MKAILAILALGACSGSLPQTRYYQLAAPAAAPVARGTSVLVVEPLSTEGAYDDERIVYRSDPYRLDYYQYHRWSTAPGPMVGGYLAQALARSGRFRSVVREATTDAAVILGGRVVSIEEIDESSTRWIGRIAIELTLTDAKSGAVVWAQPFEAAEPLAVQSPAGLARALTAAMARIAGAAAPQIADLADRQARAHGAPQPLAAQVSP